MLVVGLQHVVVDDQLPSPFEHVEKGRRPVRPGRLERRVDLGHRQPPTLRRDIVAGVRVGLLGDQELVARLSPFLYRHHPRHRRVGMASHCAFSSSSLPPFSLAHSRAYTSHFFTMTVTGPDEPLACRREPCPACKTMPMTDVSVPPHVPGQLRPRSCRAVR